MGDAAVLAHQDHVRRIEIGVAEIDLLGAALRARHADGDEIDAVLLQRRNALGIDDRNFLRRHAKLLRDPCGEVDVIADDALDTVAIGTRRRALGDTDQKLAARLDGVELVGARGHCPELGRDGGEQHDCGRAACHAPSRCLGRDSNGCCGTLESLTQSRPAGQGNGMAATGAALVTGASYGVGAATALALARAGYDVAVTATKVENLAPTVKVLQACGRRVLPIALDLRSEADIARVAKEAIATFGGVDVLVNNAGANLRKDAVDVTAAEWDALMNVNIRGTFFLTQAIGRALIAGGRGGCIVNIASTYALLGAPERSTYGISKAALVGMTRMLAVEWAEHGIRVNAVAPGRLATPSPSRAEKGADQTYMDAMLERIPLHRLATVEEVAAAVVYLASPAAASITGQGLVLDGGLAGGWRRSDGRKGRLAAQNPRVGTTFAGGVFHVLAGRPSAMARSSRVKILRQTIMPASERPRRSLARSSMRPWPASTAMSCTTARSGCITSAKRTLPDQMSRTTSMTGGAAATLRSYSARFAL